MQRCTNKQNLTTFTERKVEEVATLPHVPDPNAFEEGKSRYIAAKLAGVSPRTMHGRVSPVATEGRTGQRGRFRAYTQNRPPEPVQADSVDSAGAGDMVRKRGFNMEESKDNVVATLDGVDL